ncbi:MAG: hypothetical protein KTR25_07225 [Myxococcales bacterium]|nr:hypothetical protein [Myxococcales bacterium]
MRAGRDQRAARACFYTPAAEMTPWTEGVRVQTWREGTGCTGPRGPKGGRSHRTLTHAGYKSERSPELKDTP